MNRKKHVIFSLSNQKQFHGQFHENSKIKLIKAYFRDISHIYGYNLIYDDDIIIDDELSLKEIINYSNKSHIVFNIEEVRQLDSEEIKNKTKINVNPDDSPSVELSTQVLFFKKEIEKLRETIEEININSCILQKSMNELEKTNLKITRENEILKEQYIDLQKENDCLKNENSDLRALKIKNEEENSNDLLHRTSQNFIRKSFAENLIVPGNKKIESNMTNTNITSQSLTKRKFSKSPVNNTSTQRSSFNKKEICFSNNNSISTYNRSSFSKVLNSNTQSEQNLQSTNQNNILDKRGSINKDLIEIDEILRNPLNFDVQNNIKSDLKCEWNKVFCFLNPQELVCFSSTSKTNRLNFFKLYYDALFQKLEIFKLNLKKYNGIYRLIVLDKKFELSLSTISAFKILNKPSSLDVFNNDLDYFSLPAKNMIYQLLFQISKVFENTIETDLFKILEYIKNIITTKLNPTFGLGDYIKTLSSKACYDEDNIDKIKKILQIYDVKNINLAEIGKLCKTTGMIAFYIKDVLTYLGLDYEKDKKLVRQRTRSSSIVKVLNDMQILKYEKGRIEKQLLFIDDVLSKI